MASANGFTEVIAGKDLSTASLLIDVVKPAQTFKGKVWAESPTEYQVEVIPGKSISIFQKGTLTASFGIGDEAEYDSYNLSYIGKIRKITDKAVTIVDYEGTSMEKVKRLNFYQFCWRNWDFDADKAHAKNNEEMMYL
jgi:hypothetical protein